MIITIGDEEIKHDNVFADEKTGGTAGIAQQVREAIQREIQRANTGKSQFASGEEDKEEVVEETQAPSEKKQTPLSK